MTENEQVIHRWLAQSTRPRLTIEAAWPSRADPVGRVLRQAMNGSSPHGFVVHTSFPIYI
nr:hypothetical protein [Streptomyces sp. SID5785]